MEFRGVCNSPPLFNILRQTRSVHVLSLIYFRYILILSSYMRLCLKNSLLFRYSCIVKTFAILKLRGRTICKNSGSRQNFLMFNIWQQDVQLVLTAVCKVIYVIYIMSNARKYKFIKVVRHTCTVVHFLADITHVGLRNSRCYAAETGQVSIGLRYRLL
jgi:hypothetical protein